MASAMAAVAYRILREVKRFLADFGYGEGQRFGWAPTYHFIDPYVHRLRDSFACSDS